MSEKLELEQLPVAAEHAPMDRIGIRETLHEWEKTP